MKKTSSSQKKVPAPKRAVRKKPLVPRTQKLPPSKPKKKSPLPRLRQTPLPISPSSHPFTLPSFLPQPTAHPTPHFEFLGDLPESYGTQRLFLTPRDPHTLFAYWDFTREQILQAEKDAADGKVFLQIFTPGKERVHQIHVAPGSREWFFPTHRPATLFQAELGFYRSNGSFHHLAVSAQVSTPPDSPSTNQSVQFVTIPFHYSFRQLWDLVRSLLHPGEALAQILARLQKMGHPLPFPYALRRLLSSETTTKIFSYLGGEFIQHRRFGSFEMTEILRRRIETCPKLGSSQLHGTSPGTPPRPT